MKHFFGVLFSLMVGSAFTQAQSSSHAENIVIFTLDGLRWQEIFKGIDTVLAADDRFSRDAKGIIETWGATHNTSSRERLFPFIWQTIAQQGVLLGNREYRNRVNLMNPYWFSYPGYNEIFTGYPDRTVNSNDKVYNHNVTVLEYLHRLPEFSNRVAAFGTWDVFPFIINAPRSGIYVNAGMDSLPFPGENFSMLNQMQRLAPQPIGVRPDVITYFMAKEYLKTFKPRILYIAFDETDDYGHAGLYDQYLKSAHAQDAMMADMWTTLQSLPEYAGKTAMLITTDHGRGDAQKAEWTSHGSKILDCNQTWIAAIGPGIPELGEVKKDELMHHGQIAATIARILGHHYKPAHDVAPALAVFGF